MTTIINVETIMKYWNSNISKPDILTQQTWAVDGVNLFIHILPNGTDYQYRLFKIAQYNATIEYNKEYKQLYKISNIPEEVKNKIIEECNTYSYVKCRYLEQQVEQMIIIQNELKNENQLLKDGNQFLNEQNQFLNNKIMQLIKENEHVHRENSILQQQLMKEKIACDKLESKLKSSEDTTNWSTRKYKKNWRPYTKKVV